MSSAPFKEDALNRFRITHPDRDLKPLIRRLHRLPLLPITSDDPSSPSSSSSEAEMERELVRMELLKWRSGIERILGSISNLERQTEIYKKQTRDTVNRTEQLRATLAKEKEELERKRKLREHQVQCDQVAKRITDRGKSRKELDEQISTLTTSLEDHQASHSIYLQTTQSRLDKFNQITKLIEECRSMKLPIEPTSSLDEILVDENSKMDIDPSSSSGNTGGPSSSSKLNLSALEFQPSSSSSTTSTVPPPASTPMGPSSSSSAASNIKKQNSISSRSSAPPQQPTNSNTNTLKPPSSGHLLPTRPNQNQNSNKPASGATKLVRQGPSSGLPSRPSNLRSSTTPAVLNATGSLEDGEVGPEEGEVSNNTNDDNRKRSRGNESSGSARNTRSRAK